MSTLVIRFSSLGDIVLAGAITAKLGDVVFLTLERYAELAIALPGVVEVRTWEAHGRAGLRGFDRIIDLHASPRSRFATAFSPSQVTRVKRHDLRRRLRPALKIAPAPPVLERYAEAAGVNPSTSAWGPHTKGETLLLFPGAAHATKRWPADRFAQLGQRWPGPVIVVGSASDKPLLMQICEQIGPSASALAENGFQRTLAAIKTAGAAVGGDTGLTHLAACIGVYTIGIFGPTHPSDGYWCHPGTALSSAPGCSPCSRHGGVSCPTGDHACMKAVGVGDVWAELAGLL
jgi:ADP-heptose:LPS heptosyltransferase